MANLDAIAAPIAGDVGAVYLTARRVTNQTMSPKRTWAKQNIIMDDVRGSGIFEYDTQTGNFKLQKGTPYRITAQVGWEAKTPEFYQFGLFSVFTNEQIGPLAEALPPNKNSCNASGGLLDVIFTPWATSQYCIKISENVKAGDSSKIRADVDTFLNIVPVPLGESYLSARRSSDQKISSGKWGDARVVMDTVISDNSKIPYKDGGFSLSVGNTYRITAQLGWEAKTPEYYQFGVFDSEGTQIGQLAEALSPNSDTSYASGGVLDVLYTPVRNTTCYLRMAPNVTAGPSSKIRANVSTVLNIVTVPPQKSYLSTRRFTDQTVLLPLQNIKMHIRDKWGDIPYFYREGVFTLRGGKTYRITAQLGWRATTPGWYQFGLFNVDTNQLLGPLAEMLSPNANTCNASGGFLDVIYTPSVTEKYRLLIAPNKITPGTSTIRADVSTFMNVVEL
jgi:tRNA threonylcarbamoyladenosine modification (KEOPS) complex  Pcc1 subunit